MTDVQYKNKLLFNKRDYLVLFPPLISSVPQIEESTRQTKVKTSVLLGSVNKIFSTTKLKRTKNLK